VSAARARLAIAPWGESLDELAGVAARAEQAGLDSVWLPELHRSASVSLAAVIAGTRTIRAGTAIMWSFVRSPMVVALEALDLDELSDGRLVLGLGSGVKRLNEQWHGVPWERPVARLREVVRAVRHFIAHAHEGRPMELEGELATMRIRGYERPFAPRRAVIPIHLAAVGPQMTALAGEVADGWLGHELGSPAYLRERILPGLHRGLERAGRERGELEVVASACCVPHEDGAQARRWAAGLVAFYATVRTYEPLFEFHGFLDEAREVQRRFAAGEPERMAAAVPDAMVDALTCAGRPEEVRARLADYDGLADCVKASPPTHFVAPEVTRHVQEGILELAGAR